tara:strand:+ start:654 stop:1046 length:393 start_codon:yes stop_codon:yes gene_type:complete
MKDEITYNVKTEIKPGFFEEYVEDDIEINQEYLAIPREILVDQELKANEKMIMGAVLSFVNNGKQAFASNRLFGQMLSLSSSRVSSLISKLAKKNYIYVVKQRNADGYITRRYIHPNERYLNSCLDSTDV